MSRAALPTAALLAALAGCTATAPLGTVLPAGLARSVELSETPFFAQDLHHCGPAALAMLLGARGLAVDPQTLAPQVYLPGRQGSLQTDLLGAARRHGLLAYVLPAEPAAMLVELAAGNPVLVLQNLGVTSHPLWHYAVLIGFDAGRNQAILRSGERRRVTQTWPRFVRTWDLGGRWAMVVLAPGEVPASAGPLDYLEAVAGLEAAGQAAAARAGYRAAVSRWPGEALAWLALANRDYADGDLQAALAGYRRAVSLAPDNAIARNNLAQALLDAGCAAEARLEAARALELARGTALEQTVHGTLAAAQAADASSRCTAPPLPAAP